MTKITKEELLKLCKLSHITITDQEADALVPDLDSVLSYASRVGEIAENPAHAQPLPPSAASAVCRGGEKNQNLFREDVIVPCDPEPLLKLAPQRTYDYYVVPMILENNE